MPELNVSVPLNAVNEQLHNRYARMMTALMQENAELAAGLESVVAERDQYRAQLLAAERAPSRAGYPEGVEPPLLGGFPGIREQAAAGMFDPVDPAAPSARFDGDKHGV